jgi:hypothetical protein
MLFLSLIEPVINIFSEFIQVEELGTVAFIGAFVLAIRFGWGWLSRQCERQADLNAAEVQGTPEYIVNSFYKISSLGHSLDKPSWHHGSLRERIDNLKNAFLDNGQDIRKAYHRKIKTIKAIILFLFVFLNGYVIYSNYFTTPKKELIDNSRKLNLAEKTYSKKEYSLSEQYYLEVIATLHKLELTPRFKSLKNEQMLHAYYNLSCVYSLSGSLDKAMVSLKATLPFFELEMIKKDLNVFKIETDSDLAQLRSREDYQKFIEEVKVIEKGFGLESWKDLPPKH